MTTEDALDLLGAGWYWYAKAVESILRAPEMGNLRQDLTEAIAFTEQGLRMEACWPNQLSPVQLHLIFDRLRNRLPRPNPRDARELNDVWSSATFLLGAIVQKGAVLEAVGELKSRLGKYTDKFP